MFRKINVTFIYDLLIAFSLFLPGTDVSWTQVD